MTHAKEYVRDNNEDVILSKILYGTVLSKEVENQLTLLELAELVSKMT